MGVMYEDGEFNTCYCDKCDLRIPWREPMFQTIMFDGLCTNCYVDELISIGVIIEHDDCYEIDGRCIESFDELEEYLIDNYDYVDKERFV